MSDAKEHFAYALELVTSISLPMVLSVAIKLRVLEAIAKAGKDAKLSSQEIASRLSISNRDAGDMLDRILRLLASYSIVTCTQHDIESKSLRFYGLAPVAKYLIPNEDGVSLGPLMELHQYKSTFDAWSKLEDSILEGGTPFEKIHETIGFEYIGLDDKFNKVFNKAMVDISAILMKEILKCYSGFDNLKSLVDVGGGHGITLNMIVAKYPIIKGINLEMPHVIKDAPLYHGIEHVGGDMFQDVPQGDAIFMKTILHGWSDTHCIKLLKNCYKALPHDGKVIVVEKIVPSQPDTSSYFRSATMQDAVMMTQTPGGKERMEDEFLALAKGAGFGGMRKKCCVFTFWVMEFYK